jgi:hypothetical protein
MPAEALMPGGSPRAASLHVCYYAYVSIYVEDPPTTVRLRTSVRDRLAAAAAARHVSLGDAIEQLLAADELQRDYAEHLTATAPVPSAGAVDEMRLWEAATGEALDE